MRLWRRKTAVPYFLALALQLAPTASAYVVPQPPDSKISEWDRHEPERSTTPVRLTGFSIAVTGVGGRHQAASDWMRL